MMWVMCAYGLGTCWGLGREWVGMLGNVFGIVWAFSNQSWAECGLFGDCCVGIDRGLLGMVWDCVGLFKYGFGD